MKSILLFVLAFSIVTAFETLSFGQADTGVDPIRSHILLADNQMHWFEIRSDGAYLNDKKVANAKGPASKFIRLTPLIQQNEYWNESDDFYKNGSNGVWFIFGTSTANGMCGIPTYAVAYMDSKGNVRMSAESPPACIGDWPRTIEFEFRTNKNCQNGYPVWKLSKSLEFEGCGFTWRSTEKPKTPRKRK